MKKRWMILVGLKALVAAGAAFLFFTRDGERRALEETRRSLRQQGLKLDLAEFDLSAPAELRARTAALTNAHSEAPAHSGKYYARHNLLSDESLNLMAGRSARCCGMTRRQAPTTSPWRNC